MLKKSSYIMFVLSSVCSLGMFINTSIASGVDTNNAVIHHTASHDVSVDTIRQWHLERGFSDVGYHFIIRKDGSVEKGRDLRKQGAHAKGRNHKVGIALTGYDTFTDLQISSLNKLIRLLGVQSIEAHHEMCPGKGIRLGEK